MYKVQYVVLENGKSPFQEFLKKLDKLEKAQVLSTIDKFIEYKDNYAQIPLKLSKHLQSGIFEIRTSHLTRISRTLYFFEIGENIIITHGFIKKTEKTEISEIEKAIKLRTIFLEAAHAKNKL